LTGPGPGFSLIDSWPEYVSGPNGTFFKSKASSFRAERSKGPESSLYKSRVFRIICYAQPSGRPLGVQRATCFSSAFVGMTVLLNI